MSQQAENKVISLYPNGRFKVTNTFKNGEEPKRVSEEPKIADYSSFHPGHQPQKGYTVYPDGWITAEKKDKHLFFISELERSVTRHLALKFEVEQALKTKQAKTEQQRFARIKLPFKNNLFLDFLAQLKIYIS